MLSALRKSFTRITFIAAIALTTGLISGCDTPSARIKKNPEAFDRLTPTQQQLVRQGRVGIGFDEEAVKLALGDPDRVFEKTTDQGKTIEWHYINYRDDDGIMLYRGYYHRYWGDPIFPYYLNSPRRSEYNQTTVTFRDGRVISAVEQTS